MLQYIFGFIFGLIERIIKRIKILLNCLVGKEVSDSDSFQCKFVSLCFIHFCKCACDKAVNYSIVNDLNTSIPPCVMSNIGILLFVVGNSLLQEHSMQWTLKWWRIICKRTKFLSCTFYVFFPVNLDNKIGAVGCIPQCVPKSLLRIGLIRVNPNTNEPIRDKRGLCISTDPGKSMVHSSCL
jgi:hypothetical protein